jgi:hypothetical protein
MSATRTPSSAADQGVESIRKSKSEPGESRRVTLTLNRCTIVDGELVYNDELTARQWALNSAVECHLHTVEVIGSNPIAPTI